MRSTVIISERDNQFFCTVTGKFGGGFSGAAAGNTAEEAAIFAANQAVNYCLANEEGGDILAPKTVLEFIPEHLRSVPSRAARVGATGGAKKSDRKSAAAAVNGKKGGRPKKAT